MSAKEYSLDEIIQLSLENNGLINSRKLLMESYAWEKKDNSKPINPTIALSAGAKNVKDEPSVAYGINGVTYSPGQYFYGSMPFININQPIKFPGKQPLQNDIIENNRKIAGLDIDEARLMIRFDVIRLTYQIRANEEKLEHAFEEKSKLQLIQEYLTTRPIVSPRMRLDADIVSNKLLLINKRIHEMEGEKNSLWDELNFYLGFKEMPIIKTNWFVKGIELNENELSAKLLKQNIDLKKRILAMNIIQKNIQLSKIDLYPNPDIFVQISQESADTKENHFNVGISFPLPVFNRGANKTKSYEMKYNSAKKENQYYLDKLQNKMRRAVSEYNMQKLIISELPYKSFHKMHETLDYAEIEFKKGRITVSEFVNFLEKAHDAHTEIIDTQMMFLAKYISILNVMYEPEFIVR